MNWPCIVFRELNCRTVVCWSVWRWNAELLRNCEKTRRKRRKTRTSRPDATCGWPERAVRASYLEAHYSSWTNCGFCIFSDTSGLQISWRAIQSWSRQTIKGSGLYTNITQIAFNKIKYTDIFVCSLRWPNDRNWKTRTCLCRRRVSVSTTSQLPSMTKNWDRRFSKDLMWRTPKSQRFQLSTDTRHFQ